MDNSISKKKKGFSLAEAILAIVIIGTIAVISMSQLLMQDQKQEHLNTLGNKMLGYLSQASIEILLYNAVLDDLTRMKDDEGYFSIEDSDVTHRISKIHQKYLKDVDVRVKLDKDYFSSTLLDYYGNSTGLTLNNEYSDFFYVNDGMIIGFKLYGACNATETNTYVPTLKEKTEVHDICGSIFYDVNAFTKPNKLGKDQFIIPIGKRGIKYE